MPRRPYSLAMDREKDDRFADVGPVLAARGWSPIPVRPEDRVPLVKWQAYSQTGTAPDVDTVLGWATMKGRLDFELANTANVMGRPSHGVFGLDSDTDSQSGSDTVRFVAYDILGRSPYVRRTDSRTRLASLYRIEHMDDLVTRRMALDDEDDSVELLGNGSLMTFYGQHSKSGSTYRWDHPALNGAEPLQHSPFDVPVVTGEQVEAFIAEVHRKLGIRGHGHTNVGQIRFEKRGDIRVPHIPTAGRICDAEGRVIDGREGLLFDISRLTVRGNPHAAMDEDGQAGLRHAIYEAFCERAVTHTSSIGGKRVARYSTDEGIRADIADKVYRMCRALGSAPVQAIRDVDAYARKAGGTTKKATVSLALANAQVKKREAARAEFIPIAALGEWLAPGGYVTRAVKGVTISTPETSYADFRGDTDVRDRIIAERAIPLDVRETSARVTRETTTAITSPLIDLLTPDAPEGVVIVRGLPGTGKTTTLVKALAEIRKENGAPLRVMMLAPAHRNLAEIADAASAAGLVVRVLRGRGAVCTKPIVARLEAVGVSPGGACAATVRNRRGELVRVECPTRSVCPAYTQYADLDQVDLILAPHAYLTMTMDKAMRQTLQMVRAVVVDEGFTSTVLDAASFPLSTLRRQRVAPPIYKVDTRAGWTAAYLLAARNRASNIALTAFADDADLAARFADLEDGEQILHGAIAISSRGDTRAARVDPSSDVLSLAHILDAEETHGREEARMWRIVDERRRRILAARENPEIGVPSHEARIRIVGETVRLAWRNDLHFSDRPWLCLDGSADEAIVGRVLGKPVRTVHVRAPLRQHVTHVRHTGLSGTALRSAVDELGRTGQSALITEMADNVAQVARQHRGEVLVVVRGAAEEALKAAKRWPDRVRFGHHNGLRGLNTYEKAEAVVILGSILPSPDALDDLAAALSYDDPTPEPALVRRDGRIEWVRSTYSWPMRDGSDATAEGPGTRGMWHERMLRQLRDEDLVQNAARGRQVHRQEPMALYLVGDHVPAGTVVDLVVTPKTVLEAKPVPKPRAAQKPKLRVVA